MLSINPLAMPLSNQARMPSRWRSMVAATFFLGSRRERRAHEFHFSRNQVIGERRFRVGFGERAEVGGLLNRQVRFVPEPEIGAHVERLVVAVGRRSVRASPCTRRKRSDSL